MLWRACAAVALLVACGWSTPASSAEWSLLSPGADRWPRAAGTGDAAFSVRVPGDVARERPGDVVTVAAETEASAAGDGEDDAMDADGCGESNRACREELGKRRSDTLASIDLDIRVGGRAGNDYPCECRLEGETFTPRAFASTTFTWKAAGYCHKPLYFEQWNLERYGHSHGFIPDVFLSGAHFFVTLPILPYMMGVELPWECVYPLGYYRPGNCAPWTCPAVPISGRGLALEAATITGAVFLLP